MSEIPFHYVDLRTFAYATEDEARVVDALETFLPDETPIERTESEGHFGDRILVLSVRLERADEIRTVLDRILTPDRLHRLRSEMSERITENCELYLRFDKQSAVAGEVRDGDSITFRAKIEAYPATRERAIDNVIEWVDTRMDEQRE